jgi:glycosyltransferase involved in cell wall biosynthesis
MKNGIKEIISQTKSLVKFGLLSDNLQDFVKNLDNNTLVSEANSLRISLVMLVKNQEDHVREVLERIKLLKLNAYHVVDTGSTDSTYEILKNVKGIILHKMNWVEDYALMRNQASKFAETDWILVMDSDELLLTENLNLRLLISLLSKVFVEPFAISFEQHSKQQSYYGVPVRLYNKSNSEYYGLVHEELRNLKTGLPVPGIQTRIKIENLGSSLEEVEKFSKGERYTKLLYKMMEIEPENPRWFAHLPAVAIVDMVGKGIYEDLLLGYLFKHKHPTFEIYEVKESTYAKGLLQKYVSYCIMQREYGKAERLDKLALELFPNDTYLLFYQSFLEIEQIRIEIKSVLKKNLERYLSLNKQEAYDESLGDLQLLEVSLAELNALNGNQAMATKIVQSLTAQNVLTVWEGWHPSENMSIHESNQDS